MSTIDTPTTIDAFKAQTRRIIEAEHAALPITLDWTRADACDWADGTTGFSGNFTLVAPGYRTRSMLATYHGGKLEAR